MMRPYRIAVALIVSSAFLWLPVPASARDLCGKEAGDYTNVDVKMQARSGALDADDAVVITSSPRVGDEITRMEIVVDGGAPHALPNSNRATLRLPITLLAGTRQLSIGDVPIPSGNPLLEVYVWDNKDHCGYGQATLQVRYADRDFAIVIGVNVTKASTTELKYARDDAYDMARHLIGDLKFRPGDIWLLTDNRDETAARVPGVNTQDLQSPEVITTALDEIARKIAYSSALYVYFSGHQFVVDSNGAGYDQFFFMLPNSDINPGSGSKFSWQTLTSKLENMLHLERGVVILDACFSGGASVLVFDDPATGNSGNSIVRSGQDAGGMKIMNSQRPTHFRRTSLPNSVGLLASSSQSQPSYELRTVKHHGAFTQSLIDVAENAKKSRIRLSLVDAVDGNGPGGIDGAAKIAAGYVKAEYGESAIQTPMHERDTPWMKEPGTWAP